MKIIIFAGGVGTRLWPLSRENSPKQFDKIFNGKSTIQLTVERVASVFGIKNIYIQTVAQYKKTIKKQIPKISSQNIIIEPERRNLGPAVCLAMTKLESIGYQGPVALLWADHIMERDDEFVAALEIAKKLILLKSNRFIFLAERPRFANNNLGWIKVGREIGEIENIDYYSFAGWKYRPESKECDRMLKSGDYYWNPGYFITSAKFLLDRYKILAPNIYDCVKKGKYGQAEKITFDEAIIEKVDLKDAIVIKTNMGWSDPGTLYALKEALQRDSLSNVTKGLAVCLDTQDCLIYNLQADKIVAGIGLKGMVVVNTRDALIVVPKDEVVKISKLIEKMKEQKLTKYL